MLQYLTGYTGELTVNGVTYKSVNDAIKALDKAEGHICIELNKKSVKSPLTRSEGPTGTEEQSENKEVYKITVRQYMTKPPTVDFDFHTKWNGGKPVPFRTMVGKILKETPGMYKMSLHAEITEEVSCTCMKCGRPLNNPVSQFFGIGPECGEHGYINPFETEEELKEAVAKFKAQLREITWEGWIIKKAIENMEVIREEN